MTPSDRTVSDTLPSHPSPWRPLKILWQARLGRPALLGLVLLLIAAVLTLVVRPHLEDRGRELDARIDAAMRRSAQQAKAAAPAQRVTRPQDELPEFTQRSADLMTLISLARQSQVELPRADYKLEPVSAGDGGLVQWHVQLPVRGSYTQLRQFVASMLNGLPHAALENLQIERSDTQQSVLQTTLDLSLYYQGSGS